MLPLLLHAHATGPNPVKIAVALEALRVPYSVEMWQFGADPQNGVKGKSFLKINENGRVPALEDPNNGVVSWESGACLNYIRRVYDKGICWALRATLNRTMWTLRSGNTSS